MTKIEHNQPQDHWVGVNGRLWRHTIGRVSNLVRVPINVIGGLLQAAKIVGKTVLLPVTYSFIGIRYLATNKSYEGSMSLRGIAIDGIGFLAIVKGVAVCFARTIVAPNRDSPDFVTGMKSISKTLLGRVHAVDSFKSLSLKQIFDKAILGKRFSSK